MLHAGREFPIEIALAPAAQEVRIVRRTCAYAPEVGIRRAATLSVRVEVNETAVRHEVSVDIVPRTGCADDEIRRRVDGVGSNQSSGAQRGDVLVEADFDGCLAVAKQIV